MARYDEVAAAVADGFAAKAGQVPRVPRPRC